MPNRREPRRKRRRKTSASSPACARTSSSFSRSSGTSHARGSLAAGASRPPRDSGHCASNSAFGANHCERETRQSSRRDAARRLRFRFARALLVSAVDCRSTPNQSRKDRPKNAFRPSRRASTSARDPRKAHTAHASYATPGRAAPALHASCTRPSRFTFRGDAASPSIITASRSAFQPSGMVQRCSCACACGTASDGGVRSERADATASRPRKLLTWRRVRRYGGAALGPPSRLHTSRVAQLRARPSRARTPLEQQPARRVRRSAGGMRALHATAAAPPRVASLLRRARCAALPRFCRALRSVGAPRVTRRPDAPRVSASSGATTLSSAEPASSAPPRARVLAVVSRGAASPYGACVAAPAALR